MMHGMGANVEHRSKPDWSELCSSLFVGEADLDIMVQRGSILCTWAWVSTWSLARAKRFIMGSSEPVGEAGSFSLSDNKRNSGR